MKRAAEVAYFRQLCCLGLEPQTVTPMALAALHRLVGSDNNAFFWSGDSGDIDNVYFEAPVPAPVAAVYFGQFVNNRTREDSTIRIRGLLPPEKIVGNSARLFPAAFYGSGMYHQVWRPLGRRHVLWARVADRRGRPHGVALYRGPGDAPFGERDEAALAQLVPYLAHAMAARGRAEERFAESGESGLVILDGSGRVCHQSPEARRLLLLAAHPRLAPGGVDWTRDSHLPAVLGQLCNRLAGVWTGREGPAPVAQLQNPWGRFMFRAYFLEGGEQLGSRLLGVVVERLVPRRLVLLEKLRELPLSAKQKEVSLLLAEGLSHRAVAIQLGISLHTVADHVRKIGDKLDLSGAADLREKLAPSRYCAHREPGTLLTKV